MEKSCKNCAHWEIREKINSAYHEAIHIIGAVGECKKIELLSDCLEHDEDFNYSLLQEHKSSKAFFSACFSAELLTLSTFGCVEFKNGK